MASIFDRFATSVRKHADYRRTVAALKGLPLDVAQNASHAAPSTARKRDRRF